MYKAAVAIGVVTFAFTAPMIITINKSNKVTAAQAAAREAHEHEAHH